MNRGQAAFAGHWFKFDGIPPTVNHMYLHRGKRKILTPEAQVFRQRVFYAMGAELRNTFRPLLAACTIVIHTPRWVTQKGTVACLDSDNRVKPMLDAIQEATGKQLQDQIFTDTRVIKRWAETEHTIVYLSALQ
jgi:Holliday junction resolvase RusA-like endonuclease